MGVVTRQLLDMGAQVEQDHLTYSSGHLEQTGQLLRQYQVLQVEGEEVKEPDVD
jgi:hypothetical protein